MPRLKVNVHDKLLNAGLEVIHTNGFNASGVQDITDAAGVPKGSFYNHFESKEALGAEILKLYWQQTVLKNLHILEDNTISPLERLRGYFAALTQDIIERDYKRGCLMGNLGAELADQSNLVRENLSSLFANWVQLIAGCIREAQQAGEMRSNLEAATLASFLLNAWEGAVIRSKVDRNERALEEFNRVVLTTVLI